MKHTTKIYFAAISLLLAGLMGCTRNELPQEGDGGRTCLTVKVSDGGYTSISDESAHTRATENGYKTIFKAGDRIGLYAVKNGAIITGYDNLCLTLTDDGNGNLSWAGVVYYEGKDVKYFAYYPYQDNMVNKVNAAATDVTSFFAPLVNDWIPATDQSTPAAYTAQDLMTGNGILDGSSPAFNLSFSFTHQMALAVIQMPIARYTLSTDTDYAWEGVLPRLTFHNFTPCPMLNNIHRYLVKPASTAKLSGSYVNGTNNTKDFFFTPEIEMSSYMTYTIDGGSAAIIPYSHTLQMGDFYLEQGTLVGKDETLTWIQKANCLGVVFKVGKDVSDDCNYMLKDGTTMMTNFHGYVLAIHDVNGGKQCPWGSPDIMIGDGAGNTGNNTGLIQGQDWPYEAPGFYGYKFTNIIKKYALDNNMTLMIDFPATYWATVVYENQYTAPDNTSGWFLLSGGQANHWIANKVLLNSNIQKVTGNLSWTRYWTSSERYNGTAWRLNSAHFSYIEHDTKDNANSNSVRSLLAF